MRVLGIDPGLASIGYALLHVGDGGPADVALIEYDTFTTPPKTPEAERLMRIREWLTVYLSTRQPAAVSLERPYPMPKMAGNIVAVAMAYGVILEVVGKAGVRTITQHNPPAVKAAVGLKRGAPKKLIRVAVSDMFAGGVKLRGADDGLDAVAVAYAHVRQLAGEATVPRIGGVA